MEKTRQESENKLQGAPEFSTMIYSVGTRRLSENRHFFSN